MGIWQWKELKGIRSLIEAETVKNINKDICIKGFSIEGMKIFIENDEVNVEEQVGCFAPHQGNCDLGKIVNKEL